MEKEKLVIVQSTDLSTREFVVYQYGLSVLNLLIPQLHVSLISGPSVNSKPWKQNGDCRGYKNIKELDMYFTC